MVDNATILQVAVPVPLRKRFDYLPPINCDLRSLCPGMRVRVPFGRSKQMIGILVAQNQHSNVAKGQLKRAIEIIDHEPIIDPGLMYLVNFASDYYHHPIGEVYANILPTLIRQGRIAKRAGRVCWRLTKTGLAIDPDSLLKRAPKQAELIRQLCQNQSGKTTQELKSMGLSKTIIDALAAKQWLQRYEMTPAINSTVTVNQGPELNPDQAQAASMINASLKQFQVLVLNGVTGSGKTEVYFEVIAKVLCAEMQALVLIPEIALTPQTLARFSDRFATEIAIFHSGLTNKQRYENWLLAREGQAKIIIGTRSALFTPIPRLGVIIIDEEHDGSYKQQDGFRYHARDLAIIRAQQQQIPIILGSATPSLESQYNVLRGRYQQLLLPNRAGSAVMPKIQVIDIRSQTLQQGLSNGLLTAIERHLTAGGQILLFLNRRGYAPTLICHQCAWVARCHRCDVNMVLHQDPAILLCHHCEARIAPPRRCPSCNGEHIITLGLGTERIEQVLSQYFPNIGIARIDRDSMSKRGALQETLDAIHEGHHRIMIGTQILAKGHDFPKVSLAAIVDADGSFFSADLRASERMGQLLTQVAGRAGRADMPGEVILQTRQPDHPLLRILLTEGYGEFSKAILAERRQTQMPPFSYMALIRGEAIAKDKALDFLSQLKTQALKYTADQIKLLGPVPAPIERKAGRYRAQLLLQSPSRRALNLFLKDLVSLLEGHKQARQVRWSIDVDPQDMQ